MVGEENEWLITFHSSSSCLDCSLLPEVEYTIKSPTIAASRLIWFLGHYQMGLQLLKLPGPRYPVQGELEGGRVTE